MAAKQRVIIAGGGRYALTLARSLDDHGHDVVLIERDSGVIEDVSDEYVASVIEGDASDPDILGQADPGRSDALAAMTPDQNTNRVICEEARAINPDLLTVARADTEPEDPDVNAFLLPHRLTARLAVDLIEGKEVRILESETGELDILDVEIGRGAPVAGKTLEEVRLPEGSLVISGHDGNRLARADTVLRAGRRYVVAVEHSVADEVLNLMRG